MAISKSNVEEIAFDVFNSTKRCAPFEYRNFDTNGPQQKVKDWTRTDCQVLNYHIALADELKAITGDHESQRAQIPILDAILSITAIEKSFF